VRAAAVTRRWSTQERAGTVAALDLRTLAAAAALLLTASVASAQAIVPPGTVLRPIPPFEYGYPYPGTLVIIKDKNQLQPGDWKACQKAARDLGEAES
jgi:hypothetical protein